MDAPAAQQQQLPSATSATALLVIDCQLDFLLSGGALEVPIGAEVVAAVNRVRRSCRDGLAATIYTQDYHPPGHVSFLASHDPAAAAKVQVQVRLCSGR